MRGFSIVEVMIVIAIIATFSFVIVISDKQFADKSSRSIIAYEFATSVGLASSLVRSGQTSRKPSFIYIKFDGSDPASSDRYEIRKIKASISDSAIEGYSKVSDFLANDDNDPINTFVLSDISTKNRYTNICTESGCLNTVGTASGECPLGSDSDDPTTRDTLSKEYVIAFYPDNTVKFFGTSREHTDLTICVGNSYVDSVGQHKVKINHLGGATVSNTEV